MVEIDFTRLLIAERDAEERVGNAKRRAEEIIRKAQEEAEKIVKMKSIIDEDKIREEVERIPYEELEKFRRDLMRRLEEFSKFIDENRENIRKDILMRTLGVKI